MLKPIALATLVSGTLDILFAMGLTLLFNRQIGSMLRFVASGPFPAANGWGRVGAFSGLIVHFVLMGIMAAVFMWLVQVRPTLLKTPYWTAVAYGILTYFAMNWIAVPLRFGTPIPPKPLSIATQLFAHIVLVGIPFVLIAMRAFGALSGAAAARN